MIPRSGQVSPVDPRRRQINRWLLAGLLLVGSQPTPAVALVPRPARRTLMVGAVQMEAKLGDFDANMAQAEQLVREAAARGAQWIVLPEMFTSGIGFHENMLGTIRPWDGAPLQMLQRLGRETGATIGGSFLARHGDEVRNSFALVSPAGVLGRHDKDHPTFWENCYYQGGSDDGLIETPIGVVGSALCWELIRSATARRLRGRARLLLSGSGWWTQPDDAPDDSPNRTLNLRMLQRAPVEMARMLGAPAVHGSHAGRLEAYFSPELPDVPYNSRFQGETMIVDANGGILARRSREQGAGVITASIEIPEQPDPSLPIPDRFWIPGEMPEEWKTSWTRWFASGGDYYRVVTRPYLQTGEVADYEPLYLR